MNDVRHIITNWDPWSRVHIDTQTIIAAIKITTRHKSRALIPEVTGCVTSGTSLGTHVCTVEHAGKKARGNNFSSDTYLKYPAVQWENTQWHSQDADRNRLTLCQVGVLNVRRLWVILHPRLGCVRAAVN